MPEYSTDWDSLLASYASYLRFEKNLSDNTIEAYKRDITGFREFLDADFAGDPASCEPAAVERDHIESYMSTVYDRRIKVSSQARILSGIKSFFSYLIIADILSASPAEFVEMPKTGRKLPEVLSIGEIDAMLAAIDLGHPQGHRNKAIIETLYSCGLRVSELTSLRLGDLFFDEGFIRVTGKGDKQRLVPLSPTARKNISLWLEQRRMITPQAKSADIVFLNRRGGKLTRVMIFTIIQHLAQTAGITKKISPHTLRHSFATHLLRGGASIRQVQEMLGHESIITTEIYTHLDTKSLQKSVNEHHPLAKYLKDKE